MQRNFRRFIEQARKNSPIPPRNKRIMFGSAAVATAAGLFGGTYQYLNPTYTEKEIIKMHNKGRCIIEYGGVLYDVTEFKEKHPGGEKFIEKASGHAIDDVWRDPLFEFHLTSEMVEEHLNEMRIGKVKDKLPQLDPVAVKGIACLEIDEDMHVHDEFNAEPLMLVFDASGKTEKFFRRDHSLERPANPTLTIECDGKKIVWNNEFLKTFNTTIFQVPIVCAGAGRSGFSEKTDGTQWGVHGDAIGSMQLKVIPLKDILQRTYPEALQTNDLVIKLVGSDGYSSVIDAEMLHSTTNPVGVAMEQADGSSLPPEHGGERRFIRIGSPGFMNIKDLSHIEIQKSPSPSAISKELIRRHGDPLNHLSERVRKLLAVCPKYDPYLLRSSDGKKILDFYFDLPVSTKIYDVTRDLHDGRYVTAKGVSFAGAGPVESVCVAAAGQKEEEVPIRIPHNGTGHFVFWEHQHKLASQDDEVSMTAGARTKLFSQPDSVAHNSRGLGHLHGKAKVQLSR